MKTKKDRAFFLGVFRPMLDNFSDACRKTKLDDLPVDWMAYKLAVLLTKWAQLYTDPLYLYMQQCTSTLFSSSSISKPSTLITQRGVVNAETQTKQQRPSNV